MQSSQELMLLALIFGMAGVGLAQVAIAQSAPTARVRFSQTAINILELFSCACMFTFAAITVVSAVKLVMP